MGSAYVPRELRRRVAEQARYRCGYCQTQVAVVGMPMEIEHLIPRSRGGPTAEENLWLSCSLCNMHKGQRTLAEDPETEYRQRCTFDQGGIGAPAWRLGQDKQAEAVGGAITKEIQRVSLQCHGAG